MLINYVTKLGFISISRLLIADSSILQYRVAQKSDNITHGVQSFEGPPFHHSPRRLHQTSQQPSMFQQPTVTDVRKRQSRKTRSSAIAERPRCTLFKLWLNISAKSVHLTVLYVTALRWTNHHFNVLRHHVGT